MPGAMPSCDECAVQSAALAIASRAAGSAEPTAVASAAARRLCRLLSADAVAVFLRSGPGQLDLTATAGPRSRTARRHWRAGLPAGARRLPAAGLAPLAGARPPALLPLRSRGRLVGAIAIDSSCWTSRHKKVARAIARYIAGPLESSILTAELTAAALAAEQPIDLDGTLNAILAGVRRVVPADAAGILLREGDRARAIALDGHPKEALGHLLPIRRDTGLDRSLLDGEPVLLDDPGWDGPDAPPGAGRIRSYLGAPLMAGGEVVGVLCADGWRRGAFDAEDLRRVCRFAAHAGAALARARRYSLTLAESIVLREAAQLATHEPASDDILYRILDGVRRVVTCDAAAVVLREGAYARVSAIHGHPASVLGHRFLIEKSLGFRTTLITGQPYMSADLQAEPTYTAAPGALPIRGHLSVPLVARGESLGMLSVDSVNRGAFGPEDMARVELFAGYVAAALLNARLHNELRAAAERDPVTGLFNHRAIHDHLDRELARAQRAANSVAVAMLDLDGFKLYNDTHGHPAGDAALHTVADALTDACRQGDIVGRYGGDEFLVILPEMSPQEASELGARLRDAVAARTLQPGNGHALPLRVSVGVACYPHDGADRDILVARADARLYESKQRGDVVAPGTNEHERLLHGADAFSVLDGLVTAVDRKDRYTRAHSEEVTRLALLLGSELGLSSDTLRSLRLTGLLHDVGKIGVPDRILKKPGLLTPEEREIMNGHPALGEAIVAGLPDLAEIRTGVRSHHERWDGRGYPDGLAGTEIPLLGRLLAVPDCYSAMTTSRPYRAALPPAVALSEIARGAGAQFDPVMAEAFVRALQRTTVAGVHHDHDRLHTGHASGVRLLKEKVCNDLNTGEARREAVS